MAPTNRITDCGVGKMPTTFERRLISLFNRSCASDVTSRTPRRPRFTRLRRNAVQKARSSDGPTSIPRTWRSPSLVTPTATTVAWLVTRPLTLTLWYVASTQRYGYSVVSGRVRKASTSGSSSPQIRDTSDLDTPSSPSAFISSSTFRVETPCTYASWTTASSACSARRRGCSNDRKYVPGRTFGIASSIVPTRVSHVRIRYPLRWPVRSGVRSWRSAPMSPATSVSISACESTRMPSRSTSPSCSSRSLPTNADRSILGFAIASTPPCRPSPAKRELTERCAMAALAVYAAALTEFPPRAGTLTRSRDASCQHPDEHQRSGFVIDDSL